VVIVLGIQAKKAPDPFWFLVPILLIYYDLLVRPSGFEPPTFCSGGKRSMCMLFIP
jgi:hypothetical protein